MKLEEIDAAIIAKKASWVAERTPLLDQPIGDFTEMMGLAVGPETEAILVEANKSAISFHAPQLPRKFDWRNHQGSNWVTAIKSQGTCGSCVSFAVIAAMEVAIRRAQANPSLAIDLSEADLFFCGGCKCKGGWQVPLALNRARDVGVGLESGFPYTPRDQKCRAIPVAHRITHWTALMSRDQRKAALSEDGPIIGCLKVFEDFRAYKSGVYEHVIGAEVGLHAVCIVGYDDDEGCWIVKNSWSERFGENGFVRIKYGECCIDDAFPSYGLAIQTQAHTS